MSSAATNTISQKEVCDVKSQQVYVPGGEFWVGSTRDEREYAYRLDREITRNYAWYEREARTKAATASFCLDRFPTTNAQYKTFIDGTGRAAPYIAESAYHAQGFLVHPYEKFKAFFWRNGTFPEGTGNHPVVLVRLRDAESYCAWIGTASKRVSRLPSEVEWEKAARGTDGRYFPWGSQWMSDHLNSGGRFAGTTAVDKFPRGQSPYGAYDMAGNVFEWTASRWDPSSYTVKSCSWDDLPGTCRVAMRHGRLAESKHILIGFRCVSDIN